MVMEKKRKMKKEKTVGIKKADHAIKKSKKKKNVKIVENVDVLCTLTDSDLVTEKKRETKKDQSVGINKADRSKRKSKGKKNVKIVESVDVLSTSTNQDDKEISEGLNEQNDHSIKKSKRKKNVKIVENIDVLSTLTNQDDKEISEGLNEKKGGSKKARKEERDHRSSKKNKKSIGEEASKNEVSLASSENDDGLKRKKESKEAKKKRKKDQKSSNEVKSQENEVAVSKDDVYLISSEDEDCSKGMKKWISEYHESRPGIQILQQRIDEFITVHEEKLEKERKEREEQIAEEGWTVVTHHKGRKKTTDAETGTTVGSVAQLVVEDKLAQKKSKLVGQDFYRFQKKEAHRNDIMTLQNKFKEDMKRLQQLRAARKFKPY